MKKIINEIQRLVFEFKSVVGDRNLFPITNDSQVWVVQELEHPDEKPKWRMLDKGIAWPYSLIGNRCQTEAIEAEFGDRLVSCKRLSAEAYVGVWRESMLQAISITDMSNHGMALKCTITNSTQYLVKQIDDEKSGAKAALLSPYLTSRDDKQCKWEFNLDCLAACEAHFALTRLCPYREPDDEFYTVSVELVLQTADDKSTASAPFDLFDMGVAA